MKKWLGIPLFAAFSVGLTMGLSSPAQGQIFSSPKNISNTTGISQHARMALDNEGNIFVAWMDLVEDSSLYHAIRFSRSTDGGSTFSYPQIISDFGIHAESPRIAAGNLGYVYVVWVEWFSQRIMFCYSSDYGASFSTPKMLVSGRGAEIAVDAAGNVNIAGYSGIYPARNIYFTRSNDHGHTFSAPVNLSLGQQEAVAPRIAVDGGGKIYIVWSGWGGSGYPNKVFFRCSSDGVAFSAPINLSADLYGWAEYPEIAVDDSGNVNIVWRNASSYGNEIYFRRSTDGGVTFLTPVNISNTSDRQNLTPQIAVDNEGNISIVWCQSYGDFCEIFFSRSSDGISFSSPINISNTPTVSQRPKIAIDGEGHISVVWDDSGIFFTRSTDKGLSFPAPKSLFYGGPCWQLAVDGAGNIFVLCGQGYDEICFVRSIDSLFLDLIELTEAINVKNGIASGLDGKISAAINALTDANDKNNAAAVGALGAFISQVEHQRGINISNEDAAALIAAAQKILNLLTE